MLIDRDCVSYSQTEAKSVNMLDKMYSEYDQEKIQRTEENSYDGKLYIIKCFP